MKDDRWGSLFMSFFISTTCISIGMGIFGLFLNDGQQYGTEICLVPGVFGILSSLLGLVKYSRKELTLRQARFRDVLHLLLIEAMVFGLNYAAGTVFTPKMTAVLAASVVVIYLTVGLVLWINDKRSAAIFNEALKKYQQKQI